MSDSFETLSLHAGYTPENGGPRVLPICQSTTFRYDSTQAIADLFDLKAPGFFYTRLANPTVDAVEKKIAALEGGVGAMCTSSGQAATLAAILTLAKAGDHIVCSSSVYGGTFKLPLSAWELRSALSIKLPLMKKFLRLLKTIQRPSLARLLQIQL